MRAISSPGPMTDLMRLATSEDHISDRMAERIVDVLEAVEIDGYQRHDIARALDGRNMPLQQLEKCGAIPHIGERIPLRDDLDLPECNLARDDVVEHGATNHYRAEIKNGDETGQ